MARHILVPIDDSAQSRDALNYALADYPGEDITVIHVLEPSDLAAYSGMERNMMTNFEEIHDQRQEAAEQLLANVQEQADEYDVTVSTKLQTGDTERLSLSTPRTTRST